MLFSIMEEVSSIWSDQINLSISNYRLKGYVCKCTFVYDSYLFPRV